MLSRGLQTISELISSVDVPLADIKPPGRSFEDWERFLNECNERGLLSYSEGTRPRFAGMFGFALLRRWRWLQNARRRGMTFQQAEEAWNAAMEREHDSIVASVHEQEQRRAKAFAEREHPGSVDFDAFAHAESLGL